MFDVVLSLVEDVGSDNLFCEAQALHDRFELNEVQVLQWFDGPVQVVYRRLNFLLKLLKPVLPLLVKLSVLFCQLQMTLGFALQWLALIRVVKLLL